MAYISSLWTQCVQCISTVTVPPTGAAVSVVDPECEEMGGGVDFLFNVATTSCAQWADTGYRYHDRACELVPHTSV